ncbi:MAG: flagellar hook-basal body complex protein [Deltaproteobacteria bacterium]|nr:flagellar hook-basal body complex protein [Deltaproteobacteria bacterium]
MMTSLYTGTTGMKSYSTGMSSISNNIANLNTLAFKNAMTLYSDAVSQTVNAAHANGITEHSQLGMGVNVSVNRTMHLQGSFMQGSSPTDLAIAGKGFFGVQKDGVTQYTRAGNFRFTSDGVLVDPNGYSLLAYKVTNGVVSQTAEPVTMDFGVSGQGYMQPKATSALTLIQNLGQRKSVNSDSSNPFFNMATQWNGTQNPPLSSNQYGSTTPVTVYDGNGKPQTLNTYYDYVGTFDGKHVYQYVMGIDPAADGSAKAGTAAAGLLAAGTITFSSNGQIEDMTMFTPPDGGNTSDLSTWKPASFDASGNPALPVTFSGASAQNIGVNFGMTMDGTWIKGYASAADVNANPQALYTGKGRPLHETSSSSYEGSNGVITSSQDGFAPGYLKDITIGPDGFMIGRYSNGETMDLFQIPIYRFMNEEGLRHEGGNRYSATEDSGRAEEGLPGTENYGSLHEATLEQSNVDLATEFATMIVTQRGFQMNSKVVTTSDQLLQKALELKR